MNANKTLYQIVKENIITILVLGVSVYLSYNALVISNNIAPLRQDIEIIKTVQAHEKEDALTFVTKDEVMVELKAIDQRLTRIENKLDR